jgi:hypothetical protein
MAQETETLEQTETGALHADGLDIALEARVLTATQDMEHLGREIRDLCASSSQAGSTDLAGLEHGFGRAANVIGNLFFAAFSTSDPDLEADAARTSETASTLNLGPDDLKHLLGMRQDCLVIHDHLTDAITDARHGVLPAQEDIYQLKEHLANMPAMLETVSTHLRNTHPTPLHPGLPSLHPDIPQINEYGDPDAAIPYIKSQGNNSLGWGGTCGVVTQLMILNYEAKNPSRYDENDLVHEAIKLNYLDSTGTTNEHLGLLLQHDGWDVSHRLSSNRELLNQLADHKSVIVSVDSCLLGHGWPAPPSGPYQSDHVIWITGAESVNGHLTKVFVNDSGSDQHYSLDVQTFDKAWGTSDYLATYATSPTGDSSTHTGGRA